MQAGQLILKISNDFQIFTDKHQQKDLLVPESNLNIPKVDIHDKIIQPHKIKSYAEPIIPRSPQKDRIEIW